MGLTNRPEIGYSTHMSELKRTHTRHVVLRLISTGKVKSSLKDIRGLDRVYVLVGGVLGATRARAVRELAKTSWVSTSHPARLLAARYLSLSEQGKAVLAAWDAEFGAVGQGIDEPA